MEQLTMSVDLASIEAINNLDTARITLRWALERIQAGERLAGELAKKLDRETEARQKAEEDSRALQRAQALRVEEVGERHLYYTRMKEFVSLRLSGNPDAASLAAREIDLARLQERLHQRQLALEREHAAKNEALESEFLRLKSTVENQARKAEQAVAERQAHFEEIDRTRQEEMNQQIKGFQERVEREVGSRLAAEQNSLSKRHETRQSLWAEEKAALLLQIGEMHQQAQERIQRLLAVEKRLAIADEAVQFAAQNAAGETQRRRKLEQLQSEYQGRLKALEADEEAFHQRRKLWEAEQADKQANIDALKEELVQAIQSYKTKAGSGQALPK